MSILTRRAHGDVDARIAELLETIERLELEAATLEDENDHLRQDLAIRTDELAKARDANAAYDAQVIVQHPEGATAVHAGVPAGLKQARDLWRAGIESRVVNRQGQVVWASWIQGDGYGPPGGIVSLPFDRDMPLPTFPD